MRSAATYLMFIDADIGFVAKDVLALLAPSSKDDVDVIARDDTHKQMAPNLLVCAVVAGITDTQNLSFLTAPLVFNLVDQAEGRVPLGKPLEVAEVATGFMLIPRAKFERFDEHYPELRYRSDDPSVSEAQSDRTLYF